MTLDSDWHETGQEKDEPMTTSAQINGYEWRATLGEIRVVKAELRTMVRKSIETHDMSFMTLMALKLGEMDDLLNRLDEIGRNTK